MKIALCISGIFSCGYSAFPYIYNSFINGYNTDVFIHTWESDNPLLELYNPTNFIVENNEKILNSYGREHGYLYDKSAVLGIGNNKDNIVSMFHSINKSVGMVKSHNKKYDIIIRVRPDMYIPQKINLNNIISDIMNGLYDIQIPIPVNNQNHGGYNDKILIGNACSMYSYANIIHELFNICNTTKYIQAESILKNHLINNNIRVNQIIHESSVIRRADYSLDIHTRFDFKKYNKIQNQTFKTITKDKKSIIIK